jgi:hypothetical protein
LGQWTYTHGFPAAEQAGGHATSCH